MNDFDHDPIATTRDDAGASAFPWWAVLLCTAIAFGLELLLLLKGARPALLPPPLDAAETTVPGALYLAILFAMLVATCSALGARLAGAFGAMASGLLLALAWPALLYVSLAPNAIILGLLLASATLLFTRGGRGSSVAWVALFAALAMLVLPALRESPLGLWRVPTGMSWDRLVFWRQGSSLASPVPLLGASALFALALSAVLVLRGRREGHIVVALLLPSLVALLLLDAGWALIPFVLALLAAMGGAWVDAFWGSMRGSKRRAAVVLLLPVLVLLAVGSRFARVDEAQLSETELQLRLELAEQYRFSHRWDEVFEHMSWASEHFPEDPRVRMESAEVDIARGRYREAAAKFKQLLKEQPESLEVLMGAAWANFYTQSYVLGVRYFERILEVEPQNARALVGLGACTIHTSIDYAEAERLIMEGLAIDEELAEGHHNMAIVLMATRNIYEDEESADRLRYHARRALELNPDNGRMRRFIRRLGWDDMLVDFEPPSQAARRK